MTSKTQTHIQASDLYRLEVPSGCEVSPDGRWIVFTLPRIDEKTQKQYQNLWLLPTDGQGEARQFTYGDHSDSQPKFSPDGKTIAFVSNRGDEKQAQIYLIPLNGGEARPLTKLEGNFGDIVWSPDGSKLAMTFRKKDEEARDREADEVKKELGVVQRHITRLFYKLDGAGFLPKEQFHVWTVDVSSGQATQLTDSPIHSDSSPAWSPDGQNIAFTSNRSDDPDRYPDRVDIFVIPASGGEMRSLPLPTGDKFLPSYSPDGRWIAYFSTEYEGDWWRHIHLLLAPADGQGERLKVTAEANLDATISSMNDLDNAVMMPAIWSPDGASLYFQASEFGKTTLKKATLNVSGQTLAVEAIESVIDAEGVVANFGFDPDFSHVFYLWADMTTPAQYHVRPLTGNGEADQVLTHFNTFLDEVDLGQIETHWIKGPADNDIQGWVITPPNFDPAQSYPSILEIHGGPLAQYAFWFMHEFFYLAAQGYVVHFCNPRGGKGYGEAHAKAIENDWGGADYADMMAWTDHIAQLPYIDETRMGVTGGSYGGYMTLWIIGHTPRFKAAVAQRVVSNLMGMFGASDFNWAFQQIFGNQPPWESLDNYWRMSPMKYIGQVETPTLIIHSENDFRCPIDQGEQVFTALKYRNIPTEFVRFPGESHGLSRAGRTDRRIARLEHLARWFNTYL